jgi:hypothetical protein
MYSLSHLLASPVSVTVLLHIWRVLEPHPINANPDPALHFNADPDQAFHFNADPNPDLDSHQSDENP